MRLHLHPDQLSALAQRLRGARHREIGGLLMGEHVEEGVFRVVDISFQTSGGSSVSFVRDPKQHEDFISAFFERTGTDFTKFNYLGEWHSHPSFSATPSATDRTQMQAIVEGHNAPIFAILMVVRLLNNEELEMSAGAFRAGTTPIAATLQITERPRSETLRSKAPWWSWFVSRHQGVQVHCAPFNA